ncbi:MAG TPA: DegV family protein [Anaerolineaceae bacterium]|nr:DegV family protein [Anaerolineaceae bacterium]
MPKVALITDSTVTIPPALLAQYDIKIAPQFIIWDADNLQDTVDIQAAEFYRRLSTSRTMPTTSQASPAKFHELYKNALDQGQEVLALVISSKLSGTYQSAIQARAMFPGAPIEVVDTLSTSMAMGFVVLEIARAIEKGANLAECNELVRRLLPNIGVNFVVDTLKYLHMGGRIGGAARFVGTALDLKPVLELRDGRIEPIERVRTRRKALDRLIDIVEQRISDRTPVRLSVLHANVPEDASSVMKLVQERFEPVECILAELSPAIGTHTGPGTLGIAYLAGT